jgi:hypothetical protein
MRDVAKDSSSQAVKALLATWHKELHAPELESAEAIA